MHQTPELREIVNGAMKVITGLDWLNIPIHKPNELNRYMFKYKIGWLRLRYC